LLVVIFDSQMEQSSASENIKEEIEIDKLGVPS
jgi:hypothetical protein